MIVSSIMLKNNEMDSKMVISAKDIKNQLIEMWPAAAVRWLPDRLFELPKKSAVKARIEQCRTHRNMNFKDEISDCDDFALQLHAEVKRLSYGNQKYHWPFGEAFGIKWQGSIEKHTANIFVAEEGIFLLEPQTDEIWKASAKNDLMLLIKM